jgi:hypothetical protein
MKTVAISSAGPDKSHVDMSHNLRAVRSYLKDNGSSPPGSIS